MAGSYNHIKNGWSLIENMGDAHEAVEELMWLIESEIGEKKARWLLNEYFYPIAREERQDDEHIIHVRELMGK